jgi:hypothetical protein
MMCRVARITLIYLILGAITTVAVAWGCAVLIDVYAGRLTGSYLSDYNMGWWYWTFEQPGAFVIQRTPTERSRMAEPRWVGAIVPTWSDANKPPTREQFSERGVWIEDARGWPLLSFVHESQPIPKPPTPPRVPSRLGSDGVRVFQGPALAATRGGMLVEAPPTIPFRAIPIRPLWHGFLIDALFYGSIWFIILWMPLTLRRIARTRQGRCIACGYDLRYSLSDRCPECGVAIRREAIV